MAHWATKDKTQPLGFSVFLSGQAQALISNQHGDPMEKAKNAHYEQYLKGYQYLVIEH